MPFIVTPLQPATSVNNAVEGMFLRARSDSNMKPSRAVGSQVILTTIDRILLYTCTRDSVPEVDRTVLPAGQVRHYDPAGPVEDPPTPTYSLLAEFRIYATILIAKAVPIVHPKTGMLERHLLFLLTVKHQLVLYAFERDFASGGAVSLIPVFAEDLEAGLYQPHYDGSMLSAVTSYEVLVGGAGPRESGDSATRNPPFVAVSVFHKNVFLVDVACCIFHGATSKAQDLACRTTAIHTVAEESSEVPRVSITAAAEAEGEAIQSPIIATAKTANPSRQHSGSSGSGSGGSNRKAIIQSLVSEEYWSTIVQARKDFTAVTPQFLDETTVHCLTFGHALHGCAQQLTLYVLHSARRSRVHLVEYTLRTEGKKIVAADPSTASDAVQLAIRGLGFHSKFGEMAVEWTPSGTVQSDLEMEARQVVALRDGLCVIGSQLVTYIRPRQMAGGSAARKSPLVVTEVIPWPSPQTPSEPKSCAVVQGLSNAFFVGFANGSIIGGRLVLPADTEESGGTHAAGSSASSSGDTGRTMTIPSSTAGGSDDVKLSVVHYDALLRLAHCDRATTLDSLACVGPNTLVVGSLMGPSVVVPVGIAPHSAGVPQTLLDNYGPVMDMTVVQEGSRTSIVASTGVDKQGGLFLLRSATTFQEAFRIPWMDGLSDVLLAHNVVCFSFPQQSRFLLFATSVDDESTAANAGLESRTGSVGSGAAVTLEELEEDAAATSGAAPRDFVFNEETLALCPLDDGSIVQVTPTLCVVVGAGDGGGTRCAARFPARVARAAVMPACAAVVVSSGPSVGVFRLPTVAGSTGGAEAIAVAEGEHEVACLCVTPSGWVVWGEWLSQSLTARHADFWERPITVAIPAIPRSVCHMQFPSTASSSTSNNTESEGSCVRTVMKRFGSSKREVVVAGLSDGAIAVLSLPPPPKRTNPCGGDAEGVGGGDDDRSEFVLEETLRLSRRAVVVRPFLNGTATDAVLCCCDVPAMVHQRGNRLAVTGVALDDVDFAASCFHARRGPALTSVVASRSGNFISFGCMWADQRITRTAAPQSNHKTVGRVCYLPHFRYLAASIRLRERDVVWFSTTSSAFGPEASSAVVGQDDEAASALLSSAGGPGDGPLGFELLDNERCAFIESLAIGANNELPMDNEAYRRTFPTPSKALWNSPEWRNSTEQPAAGAPNSVGFNAILIGTCFTFPEETVPRSSRLVWGTVEAPMLSQSSPGAAGGDGGRPPSSATPAPRFISFGERDFTGCLSACCAVPKCPNRLALALNGCIVLLKWHATERSFVTENTVPIGSLLISLRPLYLADETKSGVLVAADWRHSVCAVKVHPIDNSVEIVARDASLRGVMDLQVIPPHGGGQQQQEHQQQHEPSLLSLPAATVNRSGGASSTLLGLPEGIVVDNPPSVVGYDILFADDMMNLFSVTQEVTEATQRPRTTAAAVAAAAAAAEEEDDDGAGGGGSGHNNSGTPQVSGTSAGGGSKKWTARKRLLTACQTHVGDRVTCIVPGQLSACATAAAEDAICGYGTSRFVFGTAHGALGAIAWIAELPARFYELVEQVTAEIGQNVCGGGFYYSEFREVHALGKLRIATHHLSLSHPQRSKKRTYFDTPVTTSPVPYAMDDARYVTRGVVHVDVVELFLQLPPPLQSLVVERVNDELLRDAASGRHGFPPRTLLPPKQKRAPPALRELFDPATLPLEAEAEAELATDASLKLSEQELDEANEVLQRWRLPKIPLTVGDVTELVTSLERTH